jgi:hypothetical protein
VLAVAGAVTVVSAHHSFASEYDHEKSLTITGAVTKIEWMNPHVYFYLDVKDPESDRVTSWALEMGAPAVLQRFGWRKSSMKIGDEVIVEGWAAKDGAHHGTARTVTLAATGQRLGASPYGTDGEPR